MLNKILLLLGADSSKKQLIEVLIDLAEDYFENMTGCDATDYPAIIIKMVVEDYNKLGSEGIASLSFGGGSETVINDYSDDLLRQIKRLRKIRLV